MNDTTTILADSSAENAATETKGKTLQDVSLSVFSPDELESAEMAVLEVNELCEAAGVEPRFGFDPSADFPANASLAIIPLTERVEKQGNVVRNVLITAVPTVQAIVDAVGGESWIKKQIQAILIRSAKLAALSDENSMIPVSVSDFITSGRSSAMAAFNALASLYVSALRAKSPALKIMSRELLRQILSSAEFASQHFPRIGQENWELVLKAMIAQAEKDAMEPGIMVQWLNTRNQTSAVSAEIDLSDLGAMVAKKEAEKASA